MISVYSKKDVPGVNKIITIIYRDGLEEGGDGSGAGEPCRNSAPTDRRTDGRTITHWHTFRGAGCKGRPPGNSNRAACGVRERVDCGRAAYVQLDGVTSLTHCAATAWRHPFIGPGCSRGHLALIAWKPVAFIEVGRSLASFHLSLDSLHSIYILKTKSWKGR